MTLFGCTRKDDWRWPRLAITELRLPAGGSDVHPHPDPKHVMRTYRSHILSCKRKWSTARGLVHYRKFIDTYLWAKRQPDQVRGDDATRTE